MRSRRLDGSDVVPNSLSERVIGAAIEVHRELGPGLLESAYRICLGHEFELRRIPYQREVSIPVKFKGLALDCGYRLDFIVGTCLILEIKAVEELHPVHTAQLLTYLRLSDTRLGLLLNFHVPVLKQGVRRVVNNF